MSKILNKSGRNSPKVSIIIPIFNAAEYLCACLDSAVQQTLVDIEIICVDDCSTDSSQQFVKEYAATDKRIRLISHSVNYGEGSARNTGLNDARGRYVFHLDADDTIPLNALELLYSQAASLSSDLVKGSYVLQYSDDQALSPPVTPAPRMVNTNIYESEFLQTIPKSHCTYLYRRALLEEFEIRYPTNFSIGQDLISLTKVLIYAKKVTLIPDVVYCYRQTQYSATRGLLSEQTVLDGITAKKFIYALLENAQLIRAAQGYIQRWEGQIKFWINMAHNHPPAVCTKIFSAFRALVSQRVVPWSENAPHQIRYLLALLLARKDLDAIDFLCSEEMSVGFSSPEKLESALLFVLTQVPNDIGALNNLNKKCHRLNFNLSAP